jgi:predicted Fe-Mo cluster-binding NifX family protein
VALAKDTFADILSSSIVFLAIVATLYHIPYVEGVVSIGIALLVLKVGLETAKNAVFSLLDVSPSEEIEERVREAAKSVGGVRGVIDLKLRKSGPVVLGDIAITTTRSLDVSRAHDIADRVEIKAKEEVDSLDGLNVHIEPCVPDKRLIAIPTTESKGMDSEVSENLGRARFIVLVDVSASEYVVEKVLVNEFREEKVLAGLSLSKRLANEGVDTVITKNIGEVLFHALRDDYVDIFQSKGETVYQLIEALERGDLEPISEPIKESGEIAAKRRISEMDDRSRDH